MRHDCLIAAAQKSIAMSTRTEANRERLLLLYRVERMAEGPMTILGFVWLVLLVVELTTGLNRSLEILSLVIWGVFVFDFGLKFFLAPRKLVFLRKNWLTVISLILPALRVLRFARILRALRGVRLVKVVASLNRGMKSLGKTMKRRGVVYVVVLTLAIIFGGGAGMYAFERVAPGGGFGSYWDALWWTAMLLTSLGSEYWPQTTEGRALCLLLGIYGFAVFGYITATLASFFVGRDAEEKDAPVAGTADIRALRGEVQALRALIEAGFSARRDAQSGNDAAAG